MSFNLDDVNTKCNDREDYINCSNYVMYDDQHFYNCRTRIGLTGRYCDKGDRIRKVAQIPGGKDCISYKLGTSFLNHMYIII